MPGTNALMVLSMSAFASIAGVALALPQQPNMTRTSAAEASQRPAWQQLGDTRQSEQVTAISMSFDPDGLPVYAYGWTDGERGTRIPVVAWNGQMWVELYHRTSQFPQSYREFDFKVTYVSLVWWWHPCSTLVR